MSYVDKIVDGVTDITDDVTKIVDPRTERLRIDTTSPFKLPHLIRPISTMYSGVIWGISIIWALIIASVLISKVGIEAASSQIMSSDSIIMYILAATTANYGTHIGFYFRSRGNEKINAKKAYAAIEIERHKAKVAIKREEMDLYIDKKEARQERKNKKRNDRRN